MLSIASALAIFAQRTDGLNVGCTGHLETLLAAEPRGLELPQAPLGLGAATPIDLDLSAAGVAAIRTLLCLKNARTRIFVAFPVIRLLLPRLLLRRVGAAATRTRFDGAADEPAADRAWPRRRAIRVLVVGPVPHHPLAAVLGADIALPVGDGVGHSRAFASDLACLRERPELGLSGCIEQRLALTLLGIRLGGITIPRGLRVCAQRQHSRHQRRDSASPKYGFRSHRHHSPPWIQSHLHSQTRETRHSVGGPHATHRSPSLTALAPK